MIILQSQIHNSSCYNLGKKKKEKKKKIFKINVLLLQETLQTDDQA